jgi:hypothetical protein
VYFINVISLNKIKEEEEEEERRRNKNFLYN